MEITKETYYCSVRKELPKEFHIKDVGRLRLEAFRELSEKIYGYSGWSDDIEFVVQMRRPPMTHEGKQYVVAAAFVNIVES